MRKLLSFQMVVVPLLLSTPAYAYLDDESVNQDQQQQQQQKVVDGETITTTTTKVENPRPHREAPDIVVSTAPGQSGYGLSFPGGSLGGVKTDIVDRAFRFVELCSFPGTPCNPDDVAFAIEQAKTSLEPCYAFGPAGQALSYIPWMDLKNDFDPICF